MAQAQERREPIMHSLVISQVIQQKLFPITMRSSEPMPENKLLRDITIPDWARMLYFRLPPAVEIRPSVLRHFILLPSAVRIQLLVIKLYIQITVTIMLPSDTWHWKRIHRDPTIPPWDIMHYETTPLVGSIQLLG